MKTVEEALAAIPPRQEALSKIDTEISHIILFVQQVLGDLRIGVPVEVPYATEDGHFILTYGRLGAKWQIMWGHEKEDDVSKDVPLVSASRQARAEVFSMPSDELEPPLSPMERLFIAAAESLASFAEERSPQLETARRLVAVLEKAGFVDRVGR